MRSFWETARWLIATYGALEAYRLVKFNLDFARYVDQPYYEVVGDRHDVRVRPSSRLQLQAGTLMWWGSNPARQPAFSISGVEELQAMLQVITAALFMERLGLRRRLGL